MHLPLLLVCNIFHWKRQHHFMHGFHINYSQIILSSIPSLLVQFPFCSSLNPFTGYNIQYSHWTISPDLMSERNGRVRLNEGVKDSKTYDDANLESLKYSSPDRRVSNLTLSVGASSFSHILKLVNCKRWALWVSNGSSSFERNPLLLDLSSIFGFCKRTASKSYSLCPKVCYSLSNTPR